MSKRLEELFDLATTDDESTINNTIQNNDEVVDSSLISQDTLDTIERIEAALPQVRGLEATDTELDELAAMAKDTSNTLIDLGMTVEPRFSAEIFASAATMLGHAISAKTAKINKKLKTIDLQLKKAELDRKLAIQAQREESNNTIDVGQSKVLDRTELLNALIQQAKNSDTNKK